MILTTVSNGSNRRKSGFPNIQAKITDNGMTNKAICYDSSLAWIHMSDMSPLTILEPTAIDMLIVSLSL